MKVWKPIAWCFELLNSAYIHIHGNKVLAISDSGSFPFNTDGFLTTGHDILLEQNHVVNGDDCLTVRSSATNIHFRDSYCEGGHGLSIGSLGASGSVANVQNILIENVVMVNCLFAARYKSWTGGNGLAKNMTWRDITFVDVVFPIYVTQNYWDQGLGPRPNSSTTNNTHIQDILFENFKGTIYDKPGYVEKSCVSDPCWFAVANATGREVAIFDLYPNTTSNIVAKDIFPKNIDGRPVTVMCNTTTVSNDVGFKCWNGPFIRTKAGW